MASATAVIGIIGGLLCSVVPLAAMAGSVGFRMRWPSGPFGTSEEREQELYAKAAKIRERAARVERRASSLRDARRQAVEYVEHAQPVSNLGGDGNEYVFTSTQQWADYAAGTSANQVDFIFMDNDPVSVKGYPVVFTARTAVRQAIEDGLTADQIMMTLPLNIGLMHAIECLQAEVEHEVPLIWSGQFSDPTGGTGRIMQEHPSYTQARNAKQRRISEQRRQTQARPNRIPAPKRVLDL